MAIRPKFELRAQLRDTIYSYSGYATESRKATMYSRHASVPEVNINVYKFTRRVFLLMNKFILNTAAAGHTVLVHVTCYWSNIRL